jgi:hypothetical protein
LLAPRTTPKLEDHTLSAVRDCLFSIFAATLKEDEMGRACSTNGETRNAYRILVEKPEGKRPLGRPTRRWVDNIKMDLREIGWDGVDWIELAQNRDHWRAHMNTVMNFWFP